MLLIIKRRGFLWKVEVIVSEHMMLEDCDVPFEVFSCKNDWGILWKYTNVI